MDSSCHKGLRAKNGSAKEARPEGPFTLLLGSRILLYWFSIRNGKDSQLPCVLPLGPSKYFGLANYEMICWEEGTIF